MKTINIANDFSRTPAGRYLSDGPKSGEAFREQELIPALKSAEKVILELDGGEGYGSSFLEEALGALVRKRMFTADELHRRLTIVSQDDTLEEEAWSYIDDAQADPNN